MNVLFQGVVVDVEWKVGELWVSRYYGRAEASEWMPSSDWQRDE